MRFFVFYILLVLPTVLSASPLTESEAVALAIANNPILAGSKANALALAEVSPQLGSLPDPTLSFNVLNLPLDSLSLSRQAMTQTQIGISQALPYPGKLDLRAKTADFIAQAAKHNVEEIQLVLIKNVRLYWWNLFFLDRALSIVQRNQVLLRQFVRIANTKYKTGQGLQSDVLLAQVELSKLLDVEISLKATRRDQQAAINALLSRPATNAITISYVESKDNNTFEILPNTPKIAALRALIKRPILDVQRSNIQAAQTRLDLADKNYYPDFKLGAVYGLRSSRSDLTGIMFSMSLPIFTASKQDRAVAQRQSEVVKQEFSLEDHKLKIDAEITQALSDYQASSQQAQLFKTGIIPQAVQTVASMLASYQVNKVDFLNLVRSQITSYNYETQYWQSISSAWQSWAKLEAAVGQSLDVMQKYNFKESQHE